jgi:hypothetical protein
MGTINIPKIVGEGGHPVREGGGRRVSCLKFSGLFQCSMRRRSRVETGTDVGHIMSMGTIGSIWLASGVRERIRLNGMSGRLKKACHDQLDGSSVSNRSNILAKKRGVLCERLQRRTVSDLLFPKKFL